MIVKQKNKPITGFTLIEMLFVMVVISLLIYMGVTYTRQKLQQDRIDRTVIQMQQVLNASTAYYMAFGAWPVLSSGWAGTTILQSAGYLAPGVFSNPWAPDPYGDHPTSYFLGADSGNKRLSVLTYIGIGAQAIANAKAIAGKIPSSQVCVVYGPAATTPCTPCTANNQHCFLAVSIPPPAQTLNNSTDLSYAGVYHSGACVKAPICPLAAQEPMIVVMPVAISGIMDPPSGTNCNANNPQNCNTTTYPMTSYIGYASSLSAVTAAGVSPQIPHCGTSTNANCVINTSNTALSPNAGDRYWRVCIAIDTSYGRVAPTGGTYHQWGQLMGTVAVFTRCATPNENTKNSNFSVFQQ